MQCLFRRHPGNRSNFECWTWRTLEPWRRSCGGKIIFIPPRLPDEKVGLRLWRVGDYLRLVVALPRLGFYRIELRDVGFFEASRFRAGEAHGEEGEAVLCHVERSNGADCRSKNSSFFRQRKIAFTENLAAIEAIDGP